MIQLKEQTIKISEEQKIIIENNPMAFASVDENGKPNVIAVADVKVVDDKLVITDNFMNATVINLSNNASVCLAVWNHDYKGCKIIGSAKYYTHGIWLQFVKTMKENQGYPAKAAILVEVDSIYNLMGISDT